jgi:hypothetical protein
MTKTDGKKFLEQIEAEVIRMGGGAKKGIIEGRELVNGEEIRVSMRSAHYLGSIELFTLRHLKPDDYHLMLLAVPRKRDDDVPMAHRHRRGEKE